jgi:hypothetical protein
MLTPKTTISALAIVAGLSIGFAPHACFAQSAGAATAGQAIKDYVEKQDADLAKLDKAMKPTPKPPTTTGASGTGGTSSTGGTSGFAPTPTPAPAAPSWWDKCVEGVCNFFNSLIGNEDEAKAQKEHNEAVHKLVEEKKAAEALKNDEHKTTEAPKTETKKVETTPAKAVETKTVQPETPKKAVEVKPVLPRTPKTRTSESRIAPVVISARTQPALIPASRTAPTVSVVRARMTVAPTVAPAVRPVTAPSAAAVVSTTVGQVRIVTGPTIATPRIPTPVIPQVALRR